MSAGRLAVLSVPALPTCLLPASIPLRIGFRRRPGSLKKEKREKYVATFNLFFTFHLAFCLAFIRSILSDVVSGILPVMLSPTCADTSSHIYSDIF